MILTEKNQIAIIIPAFNEEQTINKVISKGSKFADIIVVNDSSDDNTQNISERIAKYTINHKSNLGYDKTLESGIRFALMKNYKILITIDADDQHPVEKIPDFINKINSGNSLVIGKRSQTNRYIENIFALISKYFWGIEDPLCGMKAYEANTVRELREFNTYNSIGTELSFRIVKKGHKFENLNIYVKERSGSSRMGSNILTSINILKSLFLSFMIKNI